MLDHHTEHFFSRAEGESVMAEPKRADPNSALEAALPLIRSMIGC